MIRSYVDEFEARTSGRLGEMVVGRQAPPYGHKIA